MPNSDIIEINNNLTDNAKLLASGMSSPQIRKRGLIDMLGINCAISYLQANKLRIETKRSVYNIPSLYEEFKISDIYYNNYRIDIITLYKEKTVKIPKIHVDIDILPDFYFIVQIGAKIKEAKIIGFIEAKNIVGCSYDSKFYYPTLDLIFDIDKFISITKRSTPTRTVLGKHADCLGLFLKFIDNDLSNAYKGQLIQHLMNCDSCRTRFIDTMEFEHVAKSIRHYPDLMKKFEYKIQPSNSLFINEQQNGLEESLNRDEEEYYAEDEKNSENSFIVEENAIAAADENKKPVQNHKNRKAIDSIFKEIRNIEVPQIKTIIKSKHRHKIIVLIVMFVILITMALISIKNTPKLDDDNSMLEEMQNNTEDVSEYEMLYGPNEDNPAHQAKLIPKQQDIDSFDIQKPLQNQPAYSPSVAKISWEVPESIVKKQNYTNFLQLAGKNIKLNLQNDLLLVRDVPINRLVTVVIKIASNGDIQSIDLLQTSGSGPIDTSINKAVKDTLKYMKPPSHGFIARPIEVSLTIELR